MLKDRKLGEFTGQINESHRAPFRVGIKKEREEKTTATA